MIVARSAHVLCLLAWWSLVNVGLELLIGGACMLYACERNRWTPVDVPGRAPSGLRPGDFVWALRFANNADIFALLREDQLWR